MTKHTLEEKFIAKDKDGYFVMLSASFSRQTTKTRLMNTLPGKTWEYFKEQKYKIVKVRIEVTEID